MAITPTDFTFAQEISGASPLADNGGQVLLVTGDCLSPLFWDEVKDGGGDIRVCTDAEGLNEIPAFPFKCVKGSTELLLFCRLPAYTNSSKTVFIFAGNPALSQYALSDTYGRYNTLQDYDFFAPDALTDLTVNAHAVTPTDITSDTVLLGVDTATFNGTSSYINNVTNAISNAANRQITICAWVKPENLTGQTTVGSAYGFIRYNGLFLDTAIGKNNYVDWRSGAGSKVTTTSTYTTSAWNHVSGGRIADTERFATVNGAYDSATQSSRVMQGSVNFRWGDNSYKHNTLYDGRMAFLSIYDSAARTESELDTEYANQSDPALFWTKSNSWNPSRNYDNTTNTLDATHPLFANAVTGFHSRDEIAGTSMVDVATQAGATFSDSFTKNPDGSVTGTGLGNTGGTSNYATVANNPSGANAFAHSIMFFVDVDIAASASNNKAGLFCKIENSQFGGNDFTFQHYNWSDEWRGSIRSAFNTRKFYNESDDVGRNQFVMVYTPSGRKADIYRNGVLFHTLTFTDGTDTGNPWNQTKLGLGKEADKFYSSLLLDKDGDFTQQEIDDFVKDPYAMFEVSGAGGGGVVLEFNEVTVTPSIDPLVIQVETALAFATQDVVATIDNFQLQVETALAFTQPQVFVGIDNFQLQVETALAFATQDVVATIDNFQLQVETALAFNQPQVFVGIDNFQIEGGGVLAFATQDVVATIDPLVIQVETALGFATVAVGPSIDQWSMSVETTLAFASPTAPVGIDSFVLTNETLLSFQSLDVTPNIDNVQIEVETALVFSDLNPTIGIDQFYIPSGVQLNFRTVQVTPAIDNFQVDVETNLNFEGVVATPSIDSFTLSVETLLAFQSLDVPVGIDSAQFEVETLLAFGTLAAPVGIDTFNLLLNVQLGFQSIVVDTVIDNFSLGQSLLSKFDFTTLAISVEGEFITSVEDPDFAEVSIENIEDIPIFIGKTPNPN